MDSLTYINRGCSTTWRDDLSMLWRVARRQAVASPEQSRCLKHHFASASLRGLLLSVPWHLYCLTQIFITIVAGTIAQRNGQIKLVAEAKYQLNQRAITLAFHTLEMTFLPIGVAYDSSEVAIQAGLNLGYRLATRLNTHLYETKGFPEVVSGKQPLIHYPALRMTLKLYVQRIVTVVKIVVPALLFYVAHLVGSTKYQERLLRLVHQGLRIGYCQIDAARYQLAMAFPSLASPRADRVMTTSAAIVTTFVNRFLHGRTIWQAAYDALRDTR